MVQVRLMGTLQSGSQNWFDSGASHVSPGVEWTQLGSYGGKNWK